MKVADVHEISVLSLYAICQLLVRQVGFEKVDGYRQIELSYLENKDYIGPTARKLNTLDNFQHILPITKFNENLFSSFGDETQEWTNIISPLQGLIINICKERKNN
jgi:hypothetical protein